MTLFELVAKITADSSEFNTAVGKAERSGKSLKDSLSANMGKIKAAIAGALSVAVIKKGIDTVVNLANEVSAFGDRIDKQSQALGLSRNAELSCSQRPGRQQGSKGYLRPARPGHP